MSEQNTFGIQMTIMAAMLMKDVAYLVGCKDRAHARLCLNQIRDRFNEIVEVVKEIETP